MERSNTSVLNNQLASARQQLINTNSRLDSVYTMSKGMKNELAIFRNPNFKATFLRSIPNKPQQSLAIVMVNTNGGETMMAVENLPQTPHDKQYQLWALVNGTPVDMGVLPKDSVANGSFFKVKNVEGAQAFAITMEKVGGNPAPTLEEIYVMGTAI